MITQDDKALIKRLYNLTDEQVSKAIRKHLKGSMSLCAAAKVVKRNEQRKG